MSSEYDYNNPGSSPENNSGNSQENNPQEGGAYRYTAGNLPGHDNYAGSQGGYQPPYQQQASYSQYPPNSPMSGYNVTPPQEQPSKKTTHASLRAVIITAVICAVCGGLIGGGTAGFVMRNSNEETVETTIDEVLEEYSETREAAEETAEEQPEEESVSSTVVTTNSTDGSMTPQAVYDQYVNAVVAISNESITTNFLGQTSATASSGSGFIISEDGYIVTNNHVVEDATTLTVIMTSGEEYEATIIGADEESDVALIKIDGSGLPAVSLGNSDELQVGEQVCAIGNPLGELTNTLTVGYVSALDREIYESSTGTPINMFQTDCAINSGNSGGPLFDMNGNVIGITTAKYSSSSSYSASIEGIGFCIPINDALDVVSDLLEYGYVRGRAYLGITCQEISSTVTQYYNLPSGIYVNSVEAGSAAEKAALQQGDIITEVDGIEVASVSDFKALLKEYTAGETAALTVYRSNESGAGYMEVEVTFDEKQEAETAETEEQSDIWSILPGGSSDNSSYQ